MMRGRGDGNYQLQRELFLEFKEYIEDKFRNDFANPELTTCSFDEMPRSNIDSIEITLKNVRRVEDMRAFTNIIEKFRPGTILKTTEGVATGLIHYSALIPLQQERSGKTTTTIVDGPRQYHYVANSREAPNPSYLLMWMTVFGALVGVAWKTTQFNDWVVIAKGFGLY